MIMSGRARGALYGWSAKPALSRVESPGPRGPVRETGPVENHTPGRVGDGRHPEMVLTRIPDRRQLAGAAEAGIAPETHCSSTPSNTLTARGNRIASSRGIDGATSFSQSLGTPSEAECTPGFR